MKYFEKTWYQGIAKTFLDTIEPFLTARKTIFKVEPDFDHETLSDHLRDNILITIALLPKHMFLVSTGNPSFMLSFVNERAARIKTIVDAVHKTIGQQETRNGRQPTPQWPLPNLFVGTSVHSQDQANQCMETLLRIPARGHYAIVEIDKESLDLWGYLKTPEADSQRCGWPPIEGMAGYRSTHADEAACISCRENLAAAQPSLDFIVVAGTTDAAAGPVDPSVVKLLAEQCRDSETEFFFSGWGEWVPENECSQRQIELIETSGTESCVLRGGQLMFRVGARKSGRFLGGKTTDVIRCIGFTAPTTV